VAVTTISAMNAAVRHPLNVDFTWTPPRSPFRFVTVEQASTYDELGFFVVEHAFDPETVSEVVAEIDPIEHELEDLLRQTYGGKVFIARADEITFTTHLVARSAFLRAFVASSPLVDICADLIGPDVRLYWDQAVYKKPATAASFPWHQDNGYAFVEPQQYLTCWIALTDATEENGCPWVVPGLHKMGTLRHEATETGLVCFENAEGALPVPVAAGGIVVFSSLTPHCTGPNQTDEVRKSYIVQYAPNGAVVLAGGSRDKAEHVPAEAEARQFPVLVDGLPIGA
jgi:ectoine hydroxylase-related dioxygenase (phytanoyl-CoA dioxygenase family)